MYRIIISCSGNIGKIKIRCACGSRIYKTKLIGTGIALE